MSFDIEDIRIGDILVETGTHRGHEIEVARYLVYGKFVEVDDYEVRAMREITYFKTYLLYIGKEYDNHWARSNNPGSTYYLSEHEISNHHEWERIFKSPLSPLMSEERRIPREG
jgi:multimeric flavodoxin WrbA